MEEQANFANGSLQPHALCRNQAHVITRRQSQCGNDSPAKGTKQTIQQNSSDFWLISR
jgi:hypothetical protein